MEGIYLLLGTNLGDRKKKLEEASGLIRERIGTVIKSSSVYETAAWGKTNQPAFLNQVLLISSTLGPEPMMAALHTIEQDLGRVRNERWAARTIDIDILYYGDLVVDNTLHIPHPGIPDRRFTLVPLAELSPKFVHPVLQRSQQQLLEACKDTLEVKKWREHQ